MQIFTRLIPFLSFLVLLLFDSGFLWSQTEDAFQPYREVLIRFQAPDQVSSLAKDGLILDHVRFEKLSGGGFSYTTIVNNLEFEILKSSGLPFEVLIADVIQQYESLPQPSKQAKKEMLAGSQVRNFEFGSMGGYYTYVEVMAELDSMRLLYPNLITVKQSIGLSHEGRHLWMVKISDNPDVAEPEPQVLYDALHHAREPQGMMGLIYYMYYLLENYGSDPDVTYLVNSRELYFVPVVNPDGYVRNQVTNPGGGGQWRKNRRFNSPGVYGVDLNRNYGYQWGYDNNGSSPTPSSETYRGPSAFSEPEIVSMRDFINSKNFVTGSTIHTYQDIYLYAYGYTSIQPEDLDVYTQYASDMSFYTGYPWGTPWELLYFSNGRTQDWQYHEKGIFNIEPEIGSQSDGFWPSISRILPLAQLHVQPNLYLAWVAGGFVDYQDYAIVDAGNGNGYPDPGETFKLVIHLKNKGQGIASNLSTTLLSNDVFVSIDSADGSGSSNINGWSVGESDTFYVRLQPDVPAGHTADLTLQVLSDGKLREFPISDLIVGTPQVLVSEDAESGTGSWNTGQGWNTTTSQAHGGLSSLTDSPAGNYSAGANNSLTLSTPVDLSDAVRVFLEFWTKWDIEASYDFAQVLVSTNGSSWTPLAGQHTTAGSGQGVQQLNEPGYDGSRSDWVREHIDLTTYAGSPQLYLRFNLKADGGVEKDGWYIDDLSLLVFESDPVPVFGISTITLDFDSVATQTADTLALVISNTGNADLWITPVASLDNPFSVVDTAAFVVAPGNNQNFEVTFAPVLAGVFTDTLILFTNDPIYPSVAITTQGIATTLTGIDGNAAIPIKFALEPNFPNPFNPTTSIQYSVGKSARIELRVFDILGQEIRTLVNEIKNPGTYEVVWDGKNNAGRQVPSGVYFYRLQTAQFTQTRKMLFVK